MLSHDSKVVVAKHYASDQCNNTTSTRRCTAHSERLEPEHPITLNFLACDVTLKRSVPLVLCAPIFSANSMSQRGTEWRALGFFCKLCVF